MYLGIEIGGTKLQAGVGTGNSAQLVEVARSEVEARQGATGILNAIEQLTAPLVARHPIRAAGIGFGGPVDTNAGKIITSHHITGWSGFPLVQWARDRFRLPIALANDADTAALAEAHLGAGRGYDPIFYVTVGTGIGGGLVIGGKIYRGSGIGAAELGHLRPGLQATRPDMNLESHAAGWGIAAAAQARIGAPMSLRLEEVRAGSRPRGAEDVRQRLIEVEEADEEGAADLLERCGGRLDLVTAKIVGEAAAAGNRIAREVLKQACEALGWGIGQMITLVAPQRVVIGGGVSLMGEELFFGPLRHAVQRYVFPPFEQTYEIVPAALGEEVVVHGAVRLAAMLDGAEGLT
jgi:glucokinase